jgi:ankyrin repeat protein
MRFNFILSFSAAICAFAPVVSAGNEPSIADAVESGNSALVRELIASGADVNVPQIDGTTALHWAAYHDDADIAELLLRSGADVNAANRYDVRPLSLACTNGSAPLVKHLLKGGADPNSSLPGGETPLMTAARTGNLDVVKALLVAGAEIHARDRRSQTAIMFAAAEGNAEVVQYLIANRADFQAPLPSGFNPMFFAVREGKADVVRVLLKAGADVNQTFRRKGGPNYKPPRNGTSPLILAVENGHFDLAIELVKRGADPNDQRSGFTALHALTWVRKPDRGDSGDPAPAGSGNLTSLQFARAIAELGADVNAGIEKGATRTHGYNFTGTTPFLLAADKADVPYMKLLMELGADPLIATADNTTALMAASGLGTAAAGEEAGTEPEAFEAVKLLLDLGADVNTVNDHGETAMHGAAYGNFPSVVRLLADHGADITLWDRPNKRGWTPLFIAEGHRPGNFIPSPDTIKAITPLMLAANRPTNAPRPGKRNEFNEQPTYREKKPNPPKAEAAKK